MDARQIRRKPSKNDDVDIARPDRLEAIAMRRIVVEMGYWLSPLLKDHPLPVLSEWERTVDLTELHNRPSWHPTKMQTGTSVLDRMEVKHPRKDAKVSPVCRHDHNVNRRTLMTYERLTDAEREALEARKEENKRAEVAEKQARMKEVEVSLRPVLDQEEQERLKAKMKAEIEKREAEEARRKDALEAAAKRRETMQLLRTLPEDERKALVRERKRARDREREKNRVRERPSRAKAAPKPAPPPPAEPKKLGRPPKGTELNLEPTHPQLPAIEVAMQVPLHLLYEQHLAAQMASVISKAGVQHRVLTHADLQAATKRFEAKLDDLIKERPDYLYQWKARTIEHSRAKAIVKREKKRGAITSNEEAARVLGMLSPGTSKPKLGGLPEPVRSERRKEKMRSYNKAWREKQKAKKGE